MPTNRLIVKEQIATYTSVLFEAANGAGGADAVRDVLRQSRQIVAALRENADLDEALGNDAYTPEQRATIARGVFAGCDPALVDVLAVMAERGEADYLARVAEGLEALMAEKLNLVVVDVTTAVELDDHLRTVIKEKAERELGRNVVLDEHVDKSILGGIIMSTSSERIDASLLTQVENARTALKAQA